MIIVIFESIFQVPKMNNTYIYLFHLTVPLQGRYVYYSYFKNEATETKKIYGIYLRLCSYWVTARIWKQSLLQILGS